MPDQQGLKDRRVWQARRARQDRQDRRAWQDRQERLGLKGLRVTRVDLKDHGVRPVRQGR